MRARGPLRAARLAVAAWVVVVAALPGGHAFGSTGSTGTPVPILMYHVVGDAPAHAPFPELYVSPADFAAQMAWLKSRGVHAVTLRAVYDHWTKGSALPAKPIVLTFDDGYRGTYTHAFPVLRRERWAGVLNLDLSNLAPSWGLSESRVRKLIAAGWEVDSHTLTHPDLTSVDPVRLRREIEGSRAFIRRRFSVPADFFCYPSGRYDAAVIDEVRRAGYLGATTTDPGLASPTRLYTLPRIRVNGGDSPGDLAAKLRGLGVRL